MENGSVVELIEETSESEEQGWSNGLDILQSALEQSSSESEQSSEQSAEVSQQDTYSEVYSLGAYDNYTLSDLGFTMGQGACVGFAVTVCIALACWAVTLAINILKKGGN